ncbi:MAG: peptidoglycan-associated lipoprotein Pal [Magnetospirillum sp.]|nr:peptidoglycan-associated lipoprotein Pal [Magnetospirillum sp.]
MTDSRRDFLLRFAASALTAATVGCETAPDGPDIPSPERNFNVIYGPPPSRPGVPEGDRTFFDTDKALLHRDATALLDRWVAWLRAHSDRSLLIEGHADERGSREYNLALGERRAETVKRYFVYHGIDQRRIRTVSVGKERPAAVGSNEAAWAQNRRAVLIPQ